MPVDARPLLRDDFADGSGLDVPRCATLEHRRDLFGADGKHHALLRFGDPDFPRRHTRLLERHPLQVDARAAAAVERQLADDAREPAAAEVLHPGQQPGAVQLETEMHQRLLRYGVAQLYRADVALGARFQLARREGDAVDAVATGPPASEDVDVARATGTAVNQLALRHDANTADVHERVAGVARVERYLPCDGRDADAVAVVADARDDAPHQVARVLDAVGQFATRGVQLPEKQRVDQCNRLRAHADHVAQDAADAGRRAAIRVER